MGEKTRLGNWVPLRSLEQNRSAGGVLRIGDLAKETGKTVRALHLYEELGLLEPVERSKGGYRLYGVDSIDRVRWIGKLQDLGFSLNEVGRLVKDLAEMHSAPQSMKRVRALFHEKLDETRKQITRLTALSEELGASLDYLTTCQACDPDTLLGACNKCDLHQSDEMPPALVAEFQKN